MASINAATAGGGGVITTSDATGNLNLQSGGSTVVAVTSAGVAVTGTLSATGVSTFAAGSAALPAIVSTTGTADTGIWFPAADTVAASTAGAERMRIDSSGNVGIGTSSPSGKLQTSGAGSQQVEFTSTDNQVVLKLTAGGSGGSFGLVSDNGSAALRFYSYNAGAERMRIDSSGNLLVGTTSATPNPGVAFYPNGSLCTGNSNGTTGFEFAAFRRNAAQIGSITQNGTAAVAFNTISDYRLKNTIAPMTGALAKVALLKPCTYKWNADGSDGQGFIAHELQEVVEGCVTGEKDAVDAEGNPVHQGIDTSFLVATLTAAIQEQQALITQLQADVATLKGLSA
jgi:hypothetical protein